MDEAMCQSADCDNPRLPRTGRRGPRPMYCDEHSPWRKVAPPRPAKCAQPGCDAQPRDRANVTGRGRWPTWCADHDSHVQIARAPVRCAYCGTEFTPREARHRYCSSRCADIDAGRLRAEPYAPRVCADADCSVEFVPMMAVQRCCSEDHGKKRWRETARAAGHKDAWVWDDKKREASHRRRALKKGAATGAPVLLAEIAARDRWKCGLCGKRVLRSKLWPHPLSPSLDHLIPLTKGGVHDPSNVQLAHLRCNSMKGNRGGGEQLMLIG
jgi:endogenous inhibitor of DNA gyrase (YacG/DUF329 family)